jgi:Rap1a immunity proteins
MRGIELVMNRALPTMDLGRIADSASVSTMLGKSVLRLFAVVIALEVQAPARAQDTAGSMLASCTAYVARTRPEGLMEAIRMGTCAGVVQALLGVANAVQICAPPRATAAHAVRIIITHIESRPEVMRQDFVEVAVDALTTAWPCS